LPLLDASYFEKLFEGMEGRSLGFLPLDGNAGDLMIRRATFELFDTYGIKYRQISASELASETLLNPVDEIVVSGGGNMGTLWPLPYNQRNRSLKFGLPVTIFPQSFTRNDEETDCYKRVFVRERASKKYGKNFILAPDMALGMAIPEKFTSPIVETGIFLRKDAESCLHNLVTLVDPVLISNTIDEYVNLAAMFENIVTDRLHFAIAGLMAGRNVTLLPNNYHKNRSMYETWLEDLGCNWQDTTDAVEYDRVHVEELLWKRLGGVPSEILDWNIRPVPSSLCQTDKKMDIEEYLSSCSSYEQLDLYKPGVLGSLCDGKRTIEEIIMVIYSHFPGRLVSTALDVQTALSKYTNSKTGERADYWGLL